MLSVALGFFLFHAPLSAQQTQTSLDPQRQFAFDIPSQSLAKALDAFIRASATQVFFETTLTEGWQSTAVKGLFTSGTALQTLLTGTGLVARRADTDAFVIMSEPERQARSAAPFIQSYPTFMTALQVGVLDALCKTRLTRPGRYRAAVQLWVNSTGIIERGALIGSTGSAERDQMLNHALAGIPLSVAPPPEVPQPLILTVIPRLSGQAGDCAG